MRHVADRPGLTAGQVPDPGSVELLIGLLLLHRLAQLLVLLGGHDHRHHLAALADHVVVVTGGEFAHEGHGNEVDDSLTHNTAAFHDQAGGIAAGSYRDQCGGAGLAPPDRRRA